MKTWMLDKCDSIWGELVRSRGYCEICGKTGILEAHHIFGGSKKSILEIRLNIQCGACLCPGCHRGTNNEKYAAHRDNKQFLALLEKQLLHSNPARLTFINVIRHTPDSELNGKASLKVLYSYLLQKKKENPNWMDSDIEPPYGRTYV